MAQSVVVPPPMIASRSGGLPGFSYLGVFPTLTQVFLAAAGLALDSGTRNRGRERGNIQVPMLSFVLENPRARLIDVAARRVNLPFLLAEFLWHTAQREDAEMLAAYAPRIAAFSADGRRFSGSAYGPRLFGPASANAPSQWEQVLRCLRADPDSRRAVLALLGAAEDRSPENNDMTCTLALQFFARDGRLDLVASMRSNDIMRGLASDVFVFTLLQEVAAAELGLELGTYTHVAHVGQIYDTDVDWARRCVADEARGVGTMAALTGPDVWSRIHATAAEEQRLRLGAAQPTARVEDPAHPHRPLEDWTAVLARFHEVRLAGSSPRAENWVDFYLRSQGGSAA